MKNNSIECEEFHNLMDMYWSGPSHISCCDSPYYKLIIDYINKERASIVAATVEMCAKICEGVNNYDNPMTANDCADAIRAIDPASIVVPTEESISHADRK